MKHLQLSIRSLLFWSLKYLSLNEMSNLLFVCFNILVMKNYYPLYKQPHRLWLVKYTATSPTLWCIQLLQLYNIWQWTSILCRGLGPYTCEEIIKTSRNISTYHKSLWKYLPHIFSIWKFQEIFMISGVCFLMCPLWLLLSLLST